MGRAEYKRNYIFNEEDDGNELKEEYVRELGKSLQNYIRTGVKNNQLGDLLDLEEKFRDRYKERFEINKIIEAIEESSKEKMKASNYLDVEQNAKLDMKNPLALQYQKMVIGSVTEILGNELERVLKDAAYLSHINMLYEIYEQEEKLRNEEKEFAEMSSRFQRLADISEMLSKQRRVELKDLEEQAKISERELFDVLGCCEGYFNIRNTKDKVVISLSPEGKRYRDYISNSKRNYDDETLNQLVYKNCNNIIDCLKKSYNSGMKYEPQLDGLRADSQRAVRHKYFEALRNILDAQEMIYNMDDSADIMERSEKIYGKHKVRIPREWDE